MNETAVSQIAKKYGLADVEIGTMQAGYRSHVWPLTIRNGQKLMLVLYKNEPAITQTILQANIVGDYLTDHQLPARQTFTPQIMQLRAGRVTRYAALYHYLPGTTIPWEAYTMNHLKLLGWAMSDMHAQLRELTHPLPSVTAVYTLYVRRMEAYFKQPTVKQAVTKKLNLQLLVNFDTLNQTLRVCEQLTDQQALHMDFVRGNILFQSNSDQHYTLGNYQLSGILDFEKVAKGHPITDIARTVAFLLVDCQHKSEQQIRKYFLQSGYTKRGLATYSRLLIKRNGSEIDLLESLIDLFLIYDFYKFLRHNPYEALINNHHYQRTKLLLIKRRLLQLVSAKIDTISNS